MKCYNCPLKFHCALWFWDVWNVNWEMCDCTDERLIAVRTPFEVDQELLAEYKKYLTTKAR
jgi:hypothetical protein